MGKTWKNIHHNGRPRAQRACGERHRRFPMARGQKWNETPGGPKVSWIQWVLLEGWLLGTAETTEKAADWSYLHWLIDWLLLSHWAWMFLRKWDEMNIMLKLWHFCSMTLCTQWAMFEAHSSSLALFWRFASAKATAKLSCPTELTVR